jgi:hypothetical protein
MLFTPSEIFYIFQALKKHLFRLFCPSSLWFHKLPTPEVNGIKEGKGPGWCLGPTLPDGPHLPSTHRHHTLEAAGR